MMIMCSNCVSGRKWFPVLAMMLSAYTVSGETTAGAQPSGITVHSVPEVSAQVFYAESVLETETVIREISTKNVVEYTPAGGEKDTAKKEEEPVLEPMVLAGTGAVVAGTGLAVAGAFGAPVLLLFAALCFAGGAWLTAIGWKKIKAEPKKYKGEKFALANYIIIGVIGVAASFYSLYVLFAV